MKYWNYYYSTYDSPTHNSSFSEFVLNDLKNNARILDIGCGNGRDTYFFEKNGYNVTGLDICNIPGFLGKNLIINDVLNINYIYDIYYCRFFIHTLTEEHLDSFLLKLSNGLKKNDLVYIETRSTKGVCNCLKCETNFKSSIGEEHFRMLYSTKYLSDKLVKLFKISLIEESDEFAVYKNEKPFVIRIKLSKND